MLTLNIISYYCNTNSKSIKSQLRQPYLTSLSTATQIQRASNHNPLDPQAPRVELQHKFKEHQITTCFRLSLFSPYCNTNSKSIKSQRRIGPPADRCNCNTNSKSIKANPPTFKEYKNSISYFGRNVKRKDDVADGTYGTDGTDEIGKKMIWGIAIRAGIWYNMRK